MGCQGSSAPETVSGDTPALRAGPLTRVDPCDLLPAATASRLLDLPVQVVGIEVGPASLPTLVCDLGQEFAEPVVSVSFTPEPIAPDVFDDAFGNSAGGDPLRVEGLGDQAFLRTEADVRSLHVFVRGAVLSVRSSLAPLTSRQPVRQPELISLAEAATANVPVNPGLATASDPCPNVSSDDVGAALGRPPTMATQWKMADGSAMCSWGGRPGAATVEIIHGQQSIRDYHRTHDLADYVELGNLGTGSDIKAFSSIDLAGDLVITTPDQTLVLIMVVASAGYSDPSIETTDGERQLAKAILANVS